MNFTDLRIKKGYKSVRMLAAVLNKKPSAIYQWENGGNSPKAVDLSAIAKALDVPLDVLLDALKESKQQNS